MCGVKLGRVPPRLGRARLDLGVARSNMRAAWRVGMIAMPRRAGRSVLAWGRAGNNSYAHVRGAGIRATPPGLDSGTLAKSL